MRRRPSSVCIDMKCYWNLNTPVCSLNSPTTIRGYHQGSICGADLVEQRVQARTLPRCHSFPSLPLYSINTDHKPSFIESAALSERSTKAFFYEFIYPDAQAREEDGKRMSESVVKSMAEKKLLAMRMGPGKHLKGRTLMGGILEPEEVSLSQLPEHQLYPRSSCVPAALHFSSIISMHS